MEYTSITAIILYVIAFIAMVILIPSAIIFNIRAGLKYRADLAQRLEQLRMSKMMTALGIDVNVYLNHERIHDVKMQMNRCMNCENTDRCDEDLTGSSVVPEDISYCANEKAMVNTAIK